MITALTFAPIIAALFIQAAPVRRARVLALVGALFSLVLTAVMLLGFNPQGGLQFEERADWIPALGVEYFVGLDGTSALVRGTRDGIEAVINLGAGSIFGNKEELSVVGVKEGSKHFDVKRRVRKRLGRMEIA